MWRIFGALSVSLLVGTTCAPSANARQVVSFSGSFSPGTVVVRTNERSLYYVVGEGRAIRYPVGVGKAGKTWAGSAYIQGKYIRPAWSPPDDIRRDKPGIADVIPSGSSRNPMGAAALVLDRGQYAIHGTNSPGSIGHFVSYGCIRMYNADIMDLFDRVSIGTNVVVVQ
jgi:lipoprotein-anchoring transpeptidase ErfK/SrfK